MGLMSDSRLLILDEPEHGLVVISEIGTVLRSLGSLGLTEIDLPRRGSHLHSRQRNRQASRSRAQSAKEPGDAGSSSVIAQTVESWATRSR
jgi:hypothetical protein